MIITYFRSSSYNRHDDCEQAYYLEYILGIKGSGNFAADRGTTVHKILEVMAIAKKAKQDGKKTFTDDVCGKLSTSDYNLDDVINKVYNHYAKMWPHHPWTDSTRKDVHKLVNTAITCQDGAFNPANRTIIEPEQHFDITIDEPWAKYEYDIPGEGKVSGNLALKGTIDLLTEVAPGIIEIVDWKGLPVETPILKTSGEWSTMGDLKVGDIIFDKDGVPTTIKGKSLVKHKDCYKITFDDKTSAVCDDEHLWYLNNGKTVQIQDLVIGDKIPVAKPIYYPEKQLPIDPYILGVWLGDGRNRCGEISGEDSFIFEEIQRRGYRLGEDIGGKDNCPSKTIYGLTTTLKNLGLLHDKHIPDIYMSASIAQRLELLRGLMDTDGNVNSVRKQAVFTNCNEKLSHDVAKLLLSLGQRPSVGNIHRDTNFKKDVWVYPVSFRPIDINPFLIPRKADRVLKTWGYGRSNVRTIKSIDKLPNKQYTQCISVDSPSNTYLCTTNLIPTHNTGARKNWTTGEEKTYEKLCADPQLMLYYYAVRKLYPEAEQVMLTIFFIKDGGPFTICFSDDDMPKIELMIREKFNKIRATRTPKLSKTWKCKKLCHLGKNSFETLPIKGVKPIIEFRQGQPSKRGEAMTCCSQIEFELSRKGMEKVTAEYKNPEHTIGFYNAPGGPT